MSDVSFGARLDALRRLLVRHGEDGLAIAFSGGVDSSVLLHAATTALGGRACGVVADSPSLPRAELADARRVAARMGARLEVLATRELERESYRRNDGSRCYWCRQTLFERMEAWARAHGYGALAYGEIVDDRLDDRPGRRAAREFRVVAPLAEAGMTKADVRRYARVHGLDVADKPASACLASRIPVGTEVTAERLARVERAERAVRALGFVVLRVRDHGRTARLEVGQDERAGADLLRASLADALGREGFDEVEIATYRAPAVAAASALEDRQEALG